MSSMLARRAILRAAPRRGYATASEGASYHEKRAAIESHAAQTTALWRRISYYVAIPGIAVCTAWVYNVEKEHAAHEAHVRAENDGHLPEIPAYEYMNRRVKPFPWGMNTLFYNAHVNKNMEAEE